jgi:hypothetical protein
LTGERAKAALKDQIATSPEFAKNPRQPDVAGVQEDEEFNDDAQGDVRADCLATNTEYCDRCTHAATQATNVARIKTEGTKGLLQGQVAG